MRPQDDVKSGSIVIVGIVGAVLLFVSIVALTALFLHEQNRATYVKNQSQSPGEFASVKTEELEKISRYGWVDQKKGIVTIPIERAMELYAKQAATGTGK